MVLPTVKSAPYRFFISRPSLVASPCSPSNGYDDRDVEPSTTHHGMPWEHSGRHTFRHPFTIVIHVYAIMSEQPAGLSYHLHVPTAKP